MITHINTDCILPKKAMKKIGLITLGQSPRTDILPDMLMILGQDYEVLEVGALDDQTVEDVSREEVEPNDYILVSRMRNGAEVRVTKKFIVPFIQCRVNELEEMGVEVILLLCTGKFPEFKSKTLIIMPSEILKGAVDAALRKGKVGVVYPAVEQTVTAEEEWGGENRTVYADVASPYGSKKELEELSNRLANRDLDLILLNCMGYGYGMKRLIAEKTGKPVIQANALSARFVKELCT